MRETDMTKTRAERRREEREATQSENGSAPKPPDDGIDDWLLGDTPEAGDPMPLHRLQISVSDYQRANNTRYSARRQLQVAKDLDDDQMVASARIEGRRARALMDSALDGIVDSWGAISENQRDEWYGTLPAEVQAMLSRETAEVAPTAPTAEAQPQ